MSTVFEAYNTGVFWLLTSSTIAKPFCWAYLSMTAIIFWPSVHYLLLFLLQFGLCVFEFAIVTLGLGVDIAGQVFLGAVGERIAAAL